MGDHFVLLVDRLLTESTLAATIESSRNKSQGGHTMASVVHSNPDFSPQKRNSGDGSSGQKLVECRICQDEDEDSNMEIPCSCCGSLKYAHRRCVQRWCNEKGDTMCEICLQQFNPGYTSPPKLFHYGGIPMNFRRDIHNPSFIAMVATDRSFVDDDHDGYSSSSTRSVIYCRAVALIFMVLLVLRHTLPIIISGDEYPFTVYMLLLLRIIGVLLPVYVIMRALTVFHRHRRQQVTLDPSTRGETEQPELAGMNLRPRLIPVL